MFIFLDDLIRNLYLCFPLNREIGAGAGPRIVIFSYCGASTFRAFVNSINFLSSFDFQGHGFVL